MHPLNWCANHTYGSHLVCRGPPYPHLFIRGLKSTECLPIASDTLCKISTTVQFKNKENTTSPGHEKVPFLVLPAVLPFCRDLPGATQPHTNTLFNLIFKATTLQSSPFLNSPKSDRMLHQITSFFPYFFPQRDRCLRASENFSLSNEPETTFPG